MVMVRVVSVVVLRQRVKRRVVRLRPRPEPRVLPVEVFTDHLLLISRETEEHRDGTDQVLRLILFARHKLEDNMLEILEVDVILQLVVGAPRLCCQPCLLGSSSHHTVASRAEATAMVDRW